jgi:prepilin-type N-terminal cleavage/methylation domain-containing protein/prepilin-type processing-associated H-X9-DG protein
MNVNWIKQGRKCFFGATVCQQATRGFTLTELLVVLATLCVLTMVLIPALAGTQPRSKAFQCLDNMRQIATAWTLYAGDNNERLASNNDKNSTGSQSAKALNWICPGLANQNVPTLDWTTSGNNFNTSLLNYNEVFMGAHSVALLGPYIQSGINIYVCPADNYLSPAQHTATAQSWMTKYGISTRIRSCAMDGAMGDGTKWFAKGQGGAGSMPAFYNAKKMTDLVNPSPKNCWVVMDEHPDSDDDCVFYVNPADANPTTSDNVFTELPGSLHDGAAGMNFADGHAELHKWLGKMDTIPVQYVTYTDAQNINVSGDPASLNDLTWLAQHTPAAP